MDNAVYITKTCTVCAVTKILDAFHNASNGLHGKRGMCRACYNAQRSVHYAAVRDMKQAKRKEYNSRPEVIAARKALRARPETKEKDKLANQKRRATERGRQMELAGKLRYRSSLEGRAKQLMCSVNLRCKKANLPVEITVEWIAEKLKLGKCEVSGLPFDMSTERAATRRNRNVPSVDQIIAGKGYTLDNSRVVLVAVNLGLCEWGLDSFIELAKATLEHNGFKVEKDPDGKPCLLAAD